MGSMKYSVWNTHITSKYGKYRGEGGHTHFSSVFQFGLHLVANQFVNQSLSPLYVISMTRLDVVMDNSCSSCFQRVYSLFL